MYYPFKKIIQFREIITGIKLRPRIIQQAVQQNAALLSKRTRPCSAMLIETNIITIITISNTLKDFIERCNDSI